MSAPQEQPLPRRDALLKGALGVGSLYGAGMVGPYVRQALAASKSDTHIVEYMLPFEYMQVELWDRGRREVNRYEEKMELTEEQKDLIALVLGEEHQHEKAMREMVNKLGGTPPKVDGYAFAYVRAREFFVVASSLESAVVAAYNGALPNLKSKEARDLFGSITQVEGRHDAACRMQVNEVAAPEAFDLPRTEYGAYSSVLKFTGTYSY